METPETLAYICNIQIYFCNVQIKHLQRTSETEHTLKTYVYNHYNMCNISIYFCNIHLKHLQHTFKISEIFERYICNIRHILMRPPPPSAPGCNSHSRSVRPEVFHARAQGFSLRRWQMSVSLGGNTCTMASVARWWTRKLSPGVGTAVPAPSGGADGGAIAATREVRWAWGLE
jgi:hypothetical protein